VLAHLVGSVVAIERQSELAALARERMASLGLRKVEVVHGDGMLGHAAGAPYDAILCAAASPDVPLAWRQQLAPGGRIIMPLGSHEGSQQLVRFTLNRDNQLIEDRLDLVRFVPLLPGAS
jgi:protein-L-isoaspartate(D-aspartate) O-methyltransferase